MVSFEYPREETNNQSVIYRSLPLIKCLTLQFYFSAEYYLLLKGHEAHNGNWTARLYSPHISINSPRNLTFWYHMNGAGIGNLRLYRENADGSKEELFVRKGRQGVSWEQASVNLPVGFYKVLIHWWFSQCSFCKARMQKYFFL